jgi:hypothetical protein
MRTMSIPPFPDRVEIADIAAFTNARLAGEFKLSQQGSALAGYMFYPASEGVRASFGSALHFVTEPLRAAQPALQAIDDYNAKARTRCRGPDGCEAWDPDRKSDVTECDGSSGHRREDH